MVWDTPARAEYDDGNSRAGEPSSARPGYRQEPSADSDGSPKWEGYLDVEVKDAVKELELTKDAYVSYLVVGHVCFSHLLLTSTRMTTTLCRSDQSYYIHDPKPTIPPTLH